MTYRRILIATDFSAGSKAAARAAQLVAADGAQLRLAHVRPPPPTNPYAPDAAIVQATPASEMVQRALDDWARDAGLPANVETASRVGAAAHEIAEEAQAWGADLVVVGATGQTGWRAVVLGSTARGVIHRVDIDVLVARGEAPTLQRLLFATDFQEMSQRAAAKAEAIAVRSGAAVTVAHVADYDVWTWPLHEAATAGADYDMAGLEASSKEALEKVNRAQFGGKAETALRKGRAHKEIVTLAESARVDLVVIGSHNTNAVERAIVGSTAERVAEGAPCPVLLVRRGRD